MDFFEAVKRRRSVRVYLKEPVPESVIENALEAAILAPNSSNMQTTQIFWIQNAEKKSKMAAYCLGQSAAKTAAEIFVFVADASLWKRNVQILKRYFAGDSRMENYYGKMMPLLYGWKILSPVKWLFFNIAGIFRPMFRHPWSSRDVDEVALKSTALACENFMLAIAAQGYDTCPMEGFDESRVKKLCGLSRRARVAMVISVGRRDEKGIWGDQFRLPKEMIVQKI